MHHIKEAGLSKPVYTIFFEKRDNEYSLWQFKFNQEDNYNSIELVRSNKFRIISK
jgi:hypothetical protein